MVGSAKQVFKRAYLAVFFISCLKFFCFWRNLRKYSFKFGHCSKHWTTTYFIETQRVSACFLVNSATTPVTLSREVQSSRIVLESVRKEWMSVKNSSISKIPFFLGRSPESSLFDVADGTCPWKSCLIPFWNVEWTGWIEHNPSLRKDVSTSENWSVSLSSKDKLTLGPSIPKWSRTLESMSNCFTNYS